VDTGNGHDPSIGNVSRLEVHLKSKHEASKREASEREALAAAYLRAAHAYMLISMPTGTSTIFGVFQAILALLAKPDELRPHQGKLVGIEKFASGIFYYKTQGISMLHRERNSLNRAPPLSNKRWINRFRLGRVDPDRRATSRPRGELR
jgi:hypothetical protein